MLKGRINKLYRSAKKDLIQQIGGVIKLNNNQMKQIKNI
jgi:hypothetical protein